ncbi:cupin domain-containing protein [Alteraurantiacibacter aquimixticola]|uniref:Cupin domain-containing protein n=1 Tax=Alteraurantiacibacter aquimixticola TaxID=2489173 RepID=A0A4V4U8Q4_9SPHN|nr:cupin domain-containing protein [Alteraurantiacibacter aquimixticola]TIX50917.1 cupin domain-containing protein [Alteraurantiacibacter aquimixticola]
MSERPVRRIVTGHDDQGKAIFQEDGPVPRVQRIGGDYGPLFYEVWNTRESPARIDRAGGEPPEEGIQLAPPRNGTRIRVLDIPPDGDRLDNVTAEEARAHFAEVGAGDASSHSTEGSRHAHMHRTETVDYGIVLEGELTLILDEGETLCRAGDIIVQRGTNHGWANRSDRNCRIAFILIDGAYVDGLEL